MNGYRKEGQVREVEWVSEVPSSENRGSSAGRGVSSDRGRNGEGFAEERVSVGDAQAGRREVFSGDK